MSLLINGTSLKGKNSPQISPFGKKTPDFHIRRICFNMLDFFPRHMRKKCKLCLGLARKQVLQ